MQIISYLYVVCLAAVPLEAGVKVWTHHQTQPDDDAVIYHAAGKLPEGAPALSLEMDAMVETGRFSNYTLADTWYPSWAADGNLYSSWTAGSVGKSGRVYSGGRAKAYTGYATITGDDPLNLTIESWGKRIESAVPFQGRYPCGSLHFNGVWYYGTYGLDQPKKSTHDKYGWYVLGPHAGFAWSTDNGKTWNPSPRSTAKPLFPEVSRDQLDLQHGEKGPFIKFGAPHFVDFGKNMEHSPDGKAYLLGHGSEYPDVKPRKANNSWVTGDAIYLARVTPSIENMNDHTKYEYFAGRDKSNTPVWTRDFQKIKPVFSWNNHCGIVTATWNPGLKKFFMCITDGHRGITSRKKYTSYILESDQLTGTWKLVTHMPDFGPQAYFLNFPSKFISKDGKTMWLCYSANYMDHDRNKVHKLESTQPKGSGYALSLHEMHIHLKSDPPLAMPKEEPSTQSSVSKPSAGESKNILTTANNIAGKAKVTVSSVYPKYTGAGATDGIVGGFPGTIAEEWASKGQREGAWIKLSWNAPQKISKIALFDRPTLRDQVTGGTLKFSDGTFIKLEHPLKDDGTLGQLIKFAPKKVTWVKFTVNDVDPKTRNAGISEIGVFAQ